MEKKYQVFVSSTYQDLQQERQEVMQALLELDCIPVGMELFPAADDDQWTLIKGLINNCDYYILIIGGRYGSISSTGKSYTQMEYEYAIEQNIPVISFIHKEPGKISADKTEPTDEGKAKLKDFIELAKQKMCQFWNSPSDLGSKVSRSLIKLIKAKPRTGWVKANEVSSAEANKEILQLKKENEKLQEQVRKLNLHAPIGSEKLQQGEDLFTIRYSKEFSTVFPLKNTYTWNTIFCTIALDLMNSSEGGPVEPSIYHLIGLSMDGIPAGILNLYKISPEDIQTIKIQLEALGLIEISVQKRLEQYWKLTPFGRTEIVRIKALVKNDYE